MTDSAISGRCPICQSDEPIVEGAARSGEICERCHKLGGMIYGRGARLTADGARRVRELRRQEDAQGLMTTSGPVQW